MAIMRPNDPEKLGNWNVLGRLGEGGFGTVFLGEQGAQKAAIKVIRDSEIEPDIRNRFLLEITALSRISDPYIPRLIDSDLEANVPWFATEFINGPTLEAKVRFEGPLEQRAWFNLAANIFHALKTIHASGVIHKDIKPSNIILGETGNKLVDFGIAHVSGHSRVVSFGDFEGSRPFSSPESSTGKNEPRMDVFSAAATLGFAARGKGIWVGADEIQLMRSINESEPELDGLTEIQKDFLRPLLNKNPSDRPTSEDAYEACLEILSRLDSNKSDIELKAWSSHNRYSRNRFSNKGYVATGMLLILVAAGSFFTSTRPTESAQNPSSQSSSPSSSSSTTLNNPNSSSGEATTTSKEIQTNLDLSKSYFEKKDLSTAMKYAKLAADAGSAHGMYRVAYILVAQGKKSEAITWYEKAAELNYGDAFLNLGALYMSLGKTQLALDWYEKGSSIKNIGSINALGFYYGDTLNDYRKSVTYYLKSAELGDVMGMANAGFVYEEMNDFVNAKKWYTRASDLGSVDASINLGYLYEKNSDWANARKYYERAASKKDPLAMYNLAIVLGNHFGQGDKGCELLNEAITIKTIDADTLKLAKSAIAKGCSGSSVKTSSASPSTLTQSMDPNVPLSPSPSYSGSSYSEPLSSSLKSSSIFGRAFISGTDWIIPLTNSADETIPPINRVQIKDSTQPYGQWWNISYTLRNNGSTGWSAVVSDYVLQFLHSTDGKLCPEFRLALVQGGKVTYIWNKSVAPCIP